MCSRFSSQVSRTGLALILLCLAVPSVIGNDSNRSEERLVFRVWAGDSTSSVGGSVLAWTAPGELVWQQAEGSLRVILGRPKELLWKPKDPSQRSPVNPEAQGMEATLVREQGDRWRVKEAKESPPVRRGLAVSGAAAWARPILLALNGRDSVALRALDLRGPVPGDPEAFEESLLGELTFSEDPRTPVTSWARVDALRQQGLELELVALCYRDDRILALIATVYAGAASGSMDRDVLMQTGLDKARRFVDSLQRAKKIDDEQILAFLRDWQAWESGVRIEVRLFDIAPAVPNGVEETGTAGEKTKGEPH
jgi:hypothetical protein